MNRHFRSQVRLSCDGKLTRNRANSNFHTQPAIVILAPKCSDVINDKTLIPTNVVYTTHDWHDTRDAVRLIVMSGGIVGRDFKTFQRATPSSVGRSGIDRSWPTNWRWRCTSKRSRCTSKRWRCTSKRLIKVPPMIPPDIYYQSKRISCVVSIVCCVYHVCRK